ncbi:MAG: thrombospondin type 3 repeat-containing protein [bacterium]
MYAQIRIVHGTAMWFWLPLLLALVVPSSAAPLLSVSQATVVPGQPAALELRLAQGVGAYGGVNATLVFPPALMPTALTPGMLLTAQDAEVYWQRVTESNGATRLSLAVGFGSNSVASASGTLLCLSVSVAASATAGVYAVTFSETASDSLVNTRHALSSSDGFSSVAHTVAAGAVTVTTDTALDSNGNGIPNMWEVRYFGNITNITDQTDADGDGLKDKYEYLAGTDPTDTNSCLALRAANSRQGPVIQWYSIAGATYDVYRATNLVAITPFSNIAPGVSAAYPVNSYTDTTASGHVNFYDVHKR